MIRTSTKIDRRRKPAPRWEPPTSLPLPPFHQRITAALRLADRLKKESPNAR